MYLTLTPVRADTRLSLVRHGDTLVVNGAAYDFTGVTEGSVLPRDAVEARWLASDISRREGVLHLTVIAPHGPDAPESARFPAPLSLSDGAAVTFGNCAQQEV